ncbi:hypothetical protein GCM10009745_77380 [Kribbella yunnanensis]|uniref:Uncharacterized protein n=1 Tax=Kribbella yunnanensis TaxID=190194 RepID=A0ABP4V3L1_9ACTN
MRVIRGVLTVLAALLLTAGTAVAAVPASSDRIIYVLSDTFELGPNQFAAQSAWCPPGTKVTGGWVGGGAELHSSYPHGDGSGWRGAVRSRDYGMHYNVGAICVPGLTDYNIQTENAPVTAGVDSTRIAFCSTGEVVGGGASASDLNVILKRSTVFHNTIGGRSGWNAGYLNNDPVTRIVNTHAICANGTVNRTVTTSTTPTSEGMDITVRCPQPGTIPISGGGYGPGLMATSASRPYPADPTYSAFTVWAGWPQQADRGVSVICAG